MVAQTSCTMDADEEEEEWEYFYDENETETFYVSLDLSSSLASLSYDGKRKQTKSTFSEGKDRSSRRNTSTGEKGDKNENDDDVDGDEDEEDAAVDEHAQTAASYAEGNTSHQNQKIENSIQILDLHSTNPIIAYKNRVFSCSWNTLIGTGIYLNAATNEQPPGHASEGPHMSGTPWPIIGSSSIVIHGKPVTLHARPGYTNSEVLGGPSNTAAGPSEQHHGSGDSTDADLAHWYAQLAKLDLVGPGQSNDPLRQLQLPFLARFAKLKTERGENEGVTYLAKNPLRVGRGKDEVAVSEAVIARNNRSRGGRGRGRGAGHGRGRGRGTAETREVIDVDADIEVAGTDTGRMRTRASRTLPAKASTGISGEGLEEDAGGETSENDEDDET